MAACVGIGMWAGVPAEDQELGRLARHPRCSCACCALLARLDPSPSTCLYVRARACVWGGGGTQSAAASLDRYPSLQRARSLPPTPQRTHAHTRTHARTHARGNGCGCSQLRLQSARDGRLRGRAPGPAPPPPRARPCPFVPALSLVPVSITVSVSGSMPLSLSLSLSLSRCRCRARTHTHHSHTHTHSPEPGRVAAISAVRGHRRCRRSLRVRPRP